MIKELNIQNITSFFDVLRDLVSDSLGFKFSEGLLCATITPEAFDLIAW